MELAIKNFGRDEYVSLKLRGLYERRGFRRVHVNKFEEYALYVENRDFLQSKSIITFMDLNGRLLALKPDITLSVVRGIPKKELASLEKMYYVDEVYRLSRENREYQVRNQIGVEMIGALNNFSNIEIIDIALSSLALINGSFVLDISHLGFISGLLEHINLPHMARRQTLSAIHSKSAHDAAAALDSAGVSEENRNRVISVCETSGEFLSSLKKVKPLIINSQMQEAYDELKQLSDNLSHSDYFNSIRLDFSVVGDMNYYNGLIFLGYVKELPRFVLTGGRYDNLMRRMGKNNCAVGFSVTLDDLNTYLKSGKHFDFDILVTYPDDCDYSHLLSVAKKLSASGSSVRLESEASNLEAAGFTWAKRYRYLNGELKEME